MNRSEAGTGGAQRYSSRESPPSLTRASRYVWEPLPSHAACGPPCRGQRWTFSLRVSERLGGERQTLCQCSSQGAEAYLVEQYLGAMLT